MFPLTPHASPLIPLTRSFDRLPRVGRAIALEDRYCTVMSRVVTPSGGDLSEGARSMSTTTILIIVVLLIVFGGWGFTRRGR